MISTSECTASNAIAETTIYSAKTAILGSDLLASRRFMDSSIFSGSLSAKPANRLSGENKRMSSMDFWLANGALIAPPQVKNAGEERQFLQTSHAVKIEVSPVGTQIKWTQFAPNWSTLIYVTHLIGQLPAPITLSYFNAGWFSEKYKSHLDAINRVDRLMACSDVRLSTRTYVESMEAKLESLPPALRAAWRVGQPPREQSVICAVDLERERVDVAYVGPQSTLANVWGMSPVAFPRQTGHSYGRTVSQNYFEVVRQQKPVHDHVLAAMSFPDGEVRWFPYQRVIFPAGTDGSGRPMVSVLTEAAPVNIRLM